MTRGRTESEERAPGVLEAQFYAQRASAGLIITGGTYISPQSIGSIRVPGIYSETSGSLDADHRCGPRERWTDLSPDCTLWLRLAPGSAWRRFAGCAFRDQSTAEGLHANGLQRYGDAAKPGH
jgi:hypothetical protein